MTPDKVHLAGSIGLDSVEEMFRTVGELLGRRLRRLSDGEPGGRRLWISWQYPFHNNESVLRRLHKRPTQALSEGVAPSAAILAPFPQPFITSGSKKSCRRPSEAILSRNHLREKVPCIAPLSFWRRHTVSD